MTRVCAFPGCFNRPKNALLRSLVRRDPKSEAPLSFHGLPLHDPDRLRLWLVALRLDLNSSMDSIRTLRVCSQHFSADDFCTNTEDRKSDGPALKSTAVPGPVGTKTEEGESDIAQHHTPDPCSAALVKEEDICKEGSVSGPTSSETLDPRFQIKEEVQIKEEDIYSEETVNGSTHFHTPDPSSAVKTEEDACSKIKTLSAAGLPHSAPVKLEETVNDQAKCNIQDPCPAVKVKEEDHSEAETLSAAGLSDFTSSKPKVLRTSAGQVEIPVKLTLVLRNQEQTLQTSPSTSTTYYALPPTWEYQTDIKQEVKTEQDASAHVPPDTIKKEEESGWWNDRQWSVNESNLLELFKTCHRCGAKMEELKATSIGCYIKLDWGCLNGHTGQWSSSPDI